jgi:hypothetical protein
MITATQVKEVNPRISKAQIAADLANALVVFGQPVRPQDPIQVWEVHPVVSRFLETLRDREICIAIDLAAAEAGWL